MSEDSNKRFTKITGFFPNKSGNGHSVGVNGAIAEVLAQIEPGDRIFLGGLDSERPFISFAKADPAFQGDGTGGGTPSPKAKAPASPGTTTASPAAPAAKKVSFSSKFGQKQ